MGVKPRVLLMDDSEITRDATRAALEARGFEVRTASTLGQFNAILTGWAPTLVLTDVRMPGVTGAELCKWIKERVDTDTTPVVLFSDLPQTELEELARWCGADASITKARGLEQVSADLSALCEGLVW
jgi:DNA-binding response OmpR family regulator